MRSLVVIVGTFLFLAARLHIAAAQSPLFVPASPLFPGASDVARAIKRRNHKPYHYGPPSEPAPPTRRRDNVSGPTGPPEGLDKYGRRQR